MSYYEELHTRTQGLHFEGKDYHRRKIIIDAAEVKPNLFEIMAFRDNATNEEIETRYAKTPEAAAAVYNEMVSYHTTGKAPGMYTNADWQRDREFSAKPGQEIQVDIYESFFDCLPPLDLPKELKQIGRKGFQMSEPHSCDENGRQFYLTFVRYNGHYYYYGLEHHD